MSDNASATFPLDNPYALFSYEQLLVRQPHVNVTGLWRNGYHYFAVCPDIDSGLETLDGKPLWDWFEKEARVVTVSMTLVPAPPPGTIPVETRTIHEIASLKSEPLNLTRLWTSLALRLPTDFPQFSVESKPPELHIYVAAELSVDHGYALLEAVEPVRGGMTLRVHVDPERANKETPFRYRHIQGDIDLIPSRRIPKGINKKIRHAVERDEEHWRNHGRFALESDLRDPKALLPVEFRSNVSRCLINASAFRPQNLRTHIALYRRVIIALPLQGRYEDMLAGFNVTEEELMQLAEGGRVQFIAPQSVDRYPERLLSRILELDQNTLLLSRQLAAATVADVRRRIPLLYPPLGTAERRVLLEMIVENQDSQLKNVGRAFCMELGRYWTTAESRILFEGAVASSLQGIGTLIAAFIRALTGRDLLIQLVTVGASVEWAGVLGATIVPIHADQYSEQAGAELCASAYSGIRDQALPIASGRSEEVVKGLVALSSDAPILEVANTLFPGDTDRLNDIVWSITQQSVDAEALQQQIDDVNRSVQAYQRRTEAESRLDLLGTIGAFTKLVPHSDSAGPLVSLGAWAIKYIMQKALPPERESARLALDWLRAVNTWTTSDVVMVSRLRKQLSSK